MSKLAVVGDRASLLGFKGVGGNIFPVQTKGEALDRMKELLKDRSYIAILITEQFYSVMDDLELDEEATLPAIIPIPNNQGSLGIGRQRMKRMVERAVGSDIIFRDEE
jgi:V/A-type H+-transporting ATPase subunit F